MANPKPNQNRREAILEELASLTSIERGSLSEEFRERPAPDGQGMIRKGPYFKIQLWENKRNRSRRVPAREVPLLRTHLKNGERFNQLVDELAAIAIALGREQRTSHLHQERESEQDAKKTPRRKPPGKIPRNRDLPRTNPGPSQRRRCRKPDEVAGTMLT